MNIIKRSFVWLSRIRYCRGFGVQSPSAYSFIRYVINEHYPYYAYSDLRKEFPKLDRLMRKRMELYFRIANFCQAGNMLDYSKNSDIISAYLTHGCRSMKVCNVFGNGDISNAQLVRICPVEGSGSFIEKAIANSLFSSIFIVEDIHTDKVAKVLWEKLTGSNKVSVTYDLYYCGIAFFDISRHKTNYIVNF